MSYRPTKKARKLWSERANAKRERLRLANAEPRRAPTEDEITIEIRRRITGEHVHFRLLPGDRCDNYRVYVDGRLRGIIEKPPRNPGLQAGEVRSAAR